MVLGTLGYIYYQYRQEKAIAEEARKVLEAAQKKAEQELLAQKLAQEAAEKQAALDALPDLSAIKLEYYRFEGDLMNLTGDFEWLYWNPVLGVSDPNLGPLRMCSY